MIAWLNGTHGVGKTTTAALLQHLLPDSRVFDAEKVGETLMDITPGLPKRTTSSTGRRPLVVETARRVLEYAGGTLVMPMTILVEDYWRESSTGLAQHSIPVRHFLLHADHDTSTVDDAADNVFGSACAADFGLAGTAISVGLAAPPFSGWRFSRHWYRCHCWSRLRSDGGMLKCHALTA